MSPISFAKLKRNACFVVDSSDLAVPNINANVASEPFVQIVVRRKSLYLKRGSLNNYIEGANYVFKRSPLYINISAVIKSFLVK